MTSQTLNPNALPVYVQIAERLIREIAAGRLLAGERLPTERAMAQDLGVSIGTLRRALAELEKKGMLERIQGSGNYIRDPGKDTSVYAMFRLELPGGGGLPRAEVLAVDICDKPGDLPAFGTSARGSRVRRMRYLDDTIIAVEEIWLDESAGLVDAARLSDSLYHHYQTVLGFWISRAEDRVSVGATPDWAPPEFKVPKGAVTGYVERVAWGSAKTPVEFSRTWFDAARAIYMQRIR